VEGSGGPVLVPRVDVGGLDTVEMEADVVERVADRRGLADTAGADDPDRRGPVGIENRGEVLELLFAMAQVPRHPRGVEDSWVTKHALHIAAWGI